ncbi:cell division protein FtsZ [Kordiimonas sediminis]|uniref:Cell division protein FtsZ n=1 Tax=Kordiimonas sediminis TaxID=1735581 RepID=A0A919ARZ3_9PROT|nr:cell division protein FtsZ [Kordiimonas sediminis]GHF23179.1 cell division protein FtsZ [Kordiimonas sediminis]
MSIDFENTELTELTPKIAVVGVGGAGCNAVNNMISAQLQGVDFVVANTDAQALANSLADNRLQLGVQITQGLGAGAQPKVGQAAAEEALEVIDESLEGAHMAFVTAGMGGGTGTGAAPVIARRAREKGILTVGVVTRPFQFEGARRMKIAEAGIQELAANVDTLIIIPNQNLFLVANEKTTFADAFNMADEVLHSGVRGITDLMVMPGLINLDFADVRTVMSEMGKAMMGTGEASGETRAQDAAAAAISNPLLEEASLKGAKGVIINVTGGMDMTLFEVDEAVNMVRELADPEALIVFGSAFNNDLEGKLRVSVVATGIEGGADARPIPERRTQIEIQPATIRTEAPVEKPVADTSTQEAAVAEAPVVEAEQSVQHVNAEPEAAPAPVAEEPAKQEQAVAQQEISEGEAEAAFQDALISGDLLDLPYGDTVEDQESVSKPEQSLEDLALQTQGQAAFVADAPVMPKSAMMPELADTPRVDPKPEPQAETRAQQAAESEGRQERELLARKPQQIKRSLFQLMTGGARPSVEKVEAEAEVRDAASNDAKAGTVELGGVSASERPVQSQDKDQLEIPSFLRRQQN